VLSLGLAGWLYASGVGERLLRRAISRGVWECDAKFPDRRFEISSGCPTARDLTGSEQIFPPSCVTIEASAMKLRTLQAEKRAAILALARQYGAKNVRVFGSVARHDARPDSDVDFLVDLEPGRNIFDLGGLLEDLRELLESPVDLVDARCLHPVIRERVLAEALPL